MKTNFRLPPHGMGKILAFADVELQSGVLVKGFRIVDGERGIFAAVPSKSFVANGQTRYSDQVSFTDPKRRESFLADLIAAFSSWREKQTA